MELDQVEFPELQRPAVLKKSAWEMLHPFDRSRKPPPETCRQNPRPKPSRKIVAVLTPAKHGNNRKLLLQRLHLDGMRCPVNNRFDVQVHVLT
jgi:hypothetical protein